MPVKEEQHESASLNTVKKPFSKKNLIKILSSTRCHTKVLPITRLINRHGKKPYRIDRRQVVVQKVLLKTLLKNCYRQSTVQNCCQKHRFKIASKKHRIQFRVEKVPYKRADRNTVKKSLS